MRGGRWRSLVGVEADDPGQPNPTIDALAAELSRARTDLLRHSLASQRLKPALAALRRAEEILRRRPRLAITGEFNAGKSSLANALIGEETLPTAVLSNTRLPTLLRYAARPSVEAVLGDGRKRRLRAPSVEDARDIASLEVGLPSPRLRGLDILDVPGLADARLGGNDHRRVLLGADVIFWCTTSNQAWRESERLIWMGLPSQIRARGLLVMTRRDLFRNTADEKSVLARLEREAGPLFRGVAAVSSLRARKALEEGPGGGESWIASGLDELGRALDQLLLKAQDRRVARVTSALRRIATRALERLEDRL